MKKILSSFLVLAIGVGSAFAQLVITEISYNAQTPNSQGKAGGVEYLEILNNGAIPVDMNGYNIPQTANNGMNFTFPSMMIQAGEYIVITNDSLGMVSNHNINALEYDGFILNAGYTIVLNDSSGNQIDSVSYENSSPWPESANGDGASIILCDPNNDNSDSQNWSRSATYTGIKNNNRKIYGSPAMANSCSTTPLIDVTRLTRSIQEGDGNIRIPVKLENFNGGPSTANVTAVNGSGDIATDIVFGQTSVSFQGTFNEESFISFDVVDDTLNESSETIYFIISSATNGTILNDSILVTIEEDPNDRPVTRQMKLIGITEGANTGAVSMIEVMALSNIPDMSIYGIGSANVGGTQVGGTDGVEYNFPAVAGVQGKSYFLTNDSAGFVDFFGFAPDFIDGAGNQGAMTYNGDDPIELFENERVIDTYGDLTADGTGTTWEYTNGWAKRREGTGPDANTFIDSNWTYSGINNLDGPVNDSCTAPYFPVVKDTTSVNTILVHDNVYVYPNPVNTTLNIAGIENAQTIIIRDLLGNEIASQLVTDSDVALDVSEYKEGVYLIQLISKNQEVSVHRFIKH